MCKSMEGMITLAATRDKTEQRTYTQERRKKCRLAGICVTCMTKPSKPGRVTCQACIDKNKDYANRNREKIRENATRCYHRHKQKTLRCKALKYREAVANGLCGLCRSNPIAGEGYSLCTDCQKYHRERHQKKRQQLQGFQEI